jgi:hypothetical protein
MSGDDFQNRSAHTFHKDEEKENKKKRLRFVVFSSSLFFPAVESQHIWKARMKVTKKIEEK